MKVAIIVLNWNGVKYIKSCLDSLTKLKTRKSDVVEVVVVDNASTDDSPELIRKNYPQFMFLANPSNLGYAAGNNVGLEYAKDQNTDYVWVINSDIQVAPDSLTHLLDFAQAHPQAGLLAPKIYFTKGYEYHKDNYSAAQLGKVLWFAGGLLDWSNIASLHVGVDEVDRGQFDSPAISDFVVGAAMFIKTQVLTEIGTFNPDYYLYFEETDFCLRARAKGWQLWYVPMAHAWHANAQAAGIGSPLQDYFITRNRLKFGFTYAPWRTKFALFRESLRMLISGRPWQKLGVRDYYLGRFGRGSYN